MSLYKANLKGEYDFTTDEVGYWRKAYYIHSWFVQNVQDGWEIIGAECEVTKERVEELLKICKTEPTTLLSLPVMFDFEYDEDKFNRDIHTTIETLERVLREIDFEREKLIYTTII